MVRHGWQDLRRVDLLLADGSGLRGRLVGIADVPDHDLVPAMLPGRPAMTFRAGTELSVQMLALWLLSWPVRWGWIKSLTPAAHWLMPLYRLMLGWGGDRSAMQVRLCAPGVERTWTLIASNGDGPEIPVLAAELLAEEMLAGREQPGARSAARSLTLDQFEPFFAALAIRHETIEADTVPASEDPDSEILRTGNAFAAAVIAATFAAIVLTLPLTRGSPLLSGYVGVAALIIAGFHAFGVGVPLYLVASRLWPLRWWNAALGGAVVAAGPVTVASACQGNTVPPGIVAWLSLIGVIAGLAFRWALRRAGTPVVKRGTARPPRRRTPAGRPRSTLHREKLLS